MPQLDQFTYFTQFFWSCLVLFSYYIPICNDRDGVLGIGRILKLRNQLLSHRGNKIRSNDLPQKDKCSEVSIKGFSCGVSYMSSTLFEVSQWCKELAVDLLGKRRLRSSISSFGEISCSRAMEINLIYLISKSSEGTSTSEGSRLFTCRNDIMLIHVPQGQKASPRGWDGSTNNKYSSNNDWSSKWEWLEFHRMT
uniref:H(+)-transporting two-sector ATPase n=1 Tax=Zostera marina TaxID=29655 RepID=A0A1B2ARK8_ZOSMR|nr:ATPase subunit 8 [Zostera marina]ANY30690.1 ATPase subunit 8 [Zostera marina]ARX63730.1 ATPase subunit 8 [Zostera marina]WMB97362.1 ATPase subunit 8 [Zostera marina]